MKVIMSYLYKIIGVCLQMWPIKKNFLEKVSKVIKPFSWSYCLQNGFTNEYTYKKTQKKCVTNMHILGHHLKWIYINIRFFTQTPCWLFTMLNMKKRSKLRYGWMHIQPLCTLLPKTSNLSNQHILWI